ncbi:MAG TPA: hypothetical protein VNO51_12360 [Ilumatobacteraceae bacterium]|nr:hypothetical protein [Ilumatobacteraceae bacterium]
MTMTTNQHASTLRARATQLRALAVELERTPAMALERFAGTDTWRSPRADVCAHELIADQTRILHAADDLRWTALRLERCATDLECELARLRALEAS